MWRDLMFCRVVFKSETRKLMPDEEGRLVRCKARREVRVGKGDEAHRKWGHTFQ
jgi:hypothetical protein